LEQTDYVCLEIFHGFRNLGSPSFYLIGLLLTVENREVAEGGTGRYVSWRTLHHFQEKLTFNMIRQLQKGWSKIASTGERWYETSGSSSVQAKYNYEVSSMKWITMLPMNIALHGLYITSPPFSVTIKHYHCL
jgi:hypothetical protein